MRTLALMYHDVVPGRRFESSGFQIPGADRYKLEPDEFRRHMEIIAGFPERRVLLTFDDGGVGAVQAAEILEEFGRAGYFFITTDRIGTPGFLDDVQIRDLRRRGHVMGSHSCSHPARMARLTPQELEREWSESVHVLEGILGESVQTASVPGGYYSREAAAAAARTGIRTLFTSEPVTSCANVDGCLVLGRFIVQRGASERWLSALVAGRLRPRLVDYLLWNGKKLLKACGGELWLAARSRILSNRESAARSKAAGGP